MAPRTRALSHRSNQKSPPSSGRSGLSPRPLLSLTRATKRTRARKHTPLGPQGQAEQRGLLDLPASVLNEVLKFVQLTAFESDAGDESDRNPLLPLRRVSKGLRSIVDSNTTSIELYTKLKSPGEGEPSAGIIDDRNYLLPPLTRFLLDDLPRWPYLKQLILRLNWAARHVQMALDFLSVSGCGSLEELHLEADFKEGKVPENLRGTLSLLPLAQLPRLRSLTVSDLACYGSWWSGLSSLASLEELVLFSGGPMEALELPPGLKSLTLDNTDLTNRIIDVVQPLRLESCTRLENLTVVETDLSALLLPPSLETMRMSSVRIRRGAECLFNLPRLTVLEFDHVISDTPLGLSPPASLTWLQLHSQILSEPVSDWAQLANLQFLKLKARHTGHGQLPDPALLPHLETLELEDYTHFSRLSSSSLKSLKIEKGEVSYCQFDLPNLTSLALLDVTADPPVKLSLPPRLRRLELSGSRPQDTRPFLAEPFSFRMCPSTLEHLSLDAVHGSPEGLDSLPRLMHLQLKSFLTLPPLSSTMLKSLDIVGNLKQPSLPPFDGLPNLTSLRLSHLDDVTTLPPLQVLTALTSLNITVMSSLQEVLMLSNTRLKQVDIGRCYLLASLCLPDIEPRPSVHSWALDPSFVVNWVSTTE